VRIAAAAFAVLVAVFLSACEKPDASNLTSPSIRALLGTTTGNVAFNPPEQLSAPQDPPPAWKVSLELARFTELENGNPALEVVLQVKSRAGASMQLWLESDSGTVARWSGGTTREYNGPVCFQLLLADAGEAVPLASGQHYLTAAFVDPATGVVVSRRLAVTHFTPKLEGGVPEANSAVFRNLLGCRRGG